MDNEEHEVNELDTIILTSGDTTTTLRSGVLPNAIEAITPLVQAGGGMLLSTRLAGLHLFIRQDGPPGCALIEFRAPDETPCIISGVVWDEAQADTMWDFLLTEARGSLKVAAVLRQPKVPWIGNVMFPVMMEFTDEEMMMMGAIERAVVFAILNEAGL